MTLTDRFAWLAGENGEMILARDGRPVGGVARTYTRGKASGWSWTFEGGRRLHPAGEIYRTAAEAKDNLMAFALGFYSGS